MLVLGEFIAKRSSKFNIEKCILRALKALL